MFASEPTVLHQTTILNSNSSYDDLERADTQSLAKTNSKAEVKLNLKSSNQTLAEADFNLTKTEGGKGNTFVDFNLTKTQKDSKLPTGKTLRKPDVEKIATMVNQERVDDVYSALAQVKIRAENIQSNITDQYSCEDSKLLEVIIEHILLHWDDITAVLIDEII